MENEFPGAPAPIQSKNLLFGCYSLKHAGDLIGFSTAQMATQFGYSLLEWRQIEANMMAIDKAKLSEIEDFIRQELARSKAAID